MGMFRATPGGALDALSLRIQHARAVLPQLLADEVRNTANRAAQALAESAPHGSAEGETTPIAGDAPGRLYESFHVESVGQMAAEVLCNQPHKLDFVVNGRGPVRPVRKKALMWPGLPHPVKYARPTEPNDFVSPAIEDALQETDAAMSDLLLELVAILEGA